MTIKEIEDKIKKYTKLLEIEKEKAEKEKDSYIGRYYKVNTTYDTTIGQLKNFSTVPRYDYEGEEIWFYADNQELIHTPMEPRKLSELEFISKEEFDELFQKIINQLIEKFN